jgi:hypothetical protein
MSTKPAPNFELEVDGGDSDLFTNGRENLVTPEKPTPTTVYFYPLPNYEQNRQHDPRSRDTENKHQAPYKSGWLERFEQTADPGWYFVEFRGGNRIVPGGEPYEVKPSGRIGETVRPQFAQAQPRELPTSSAVNETASTVEAVQRLIKTVTPPVPPAAPVTAEDMKRLLDETADRAAARAVEQYKAAQPATPPLDPFAFMERSLSLQEQMRQAALASNPPVTTPASPVDPAEQFEKQLETYKRLSEIVNPISERDDRERGIFDKILGAIEGAGKAAPALLPLIKPMMPARIQALMAGADASDAATVAETQTQATQSPQQPTQAARSQPAAPQDENEAMTLIAHVAISEMIKNKRPGRTADLCEDMVTRFPTLAPMLKQLFETEPADILTALGQFVGRDDLASFRHAREWVLDLIDELSPDDESEPEGDQLTGDAPSIVDLANSQPN